MGSDPIYYVKQGGQVVVKTQTQGSVLLLDEIIHLSCRTLALPVPIKKGRLVIEPLPILKMLTDELLCHGSGIDKRHIPITRKVSRIEAEKSR